jgi:hypothetical protein
MYVCDLSLKNPGCATSRKIYECDGVNITFPIICKKGYPLKNRITQERKSKLIVHRLDKPLVQVFGDIAILTFTDVFTIDANTSHWHATEIYQRRENEWKLIHSHWTESKVK